MVPPELNILGTVINGKHWLPAFPHKTYQNFDIKYMLLTYSMYKMQKKFKVLFWSLKKERKSVLKHLNLADKQKHN